MDESNQQLVGNVGSGSKLTHYRNVHPLDWKNPQPAARYNLVVLGAGTAGLVTAAGAAGLGAKVAPIEKHLMGGDCLNVGCVPSKTLIRAARAAHEARMAGRFGRVRHRVDVEPHRKRFGTAARAGRICARPSSRGTDAYRDAQPHFLE